MFTFQMQAYFPSIILPETQAWLSGNRPSSHHLNSIHRVLQEVQPLHIFALNNFAAVSAGETLHDLCLYQTATLCIVLSRHHCPGTHCCIIQRVILLPGEIFVPPTLANAKNTPRCYNGINYSIFTSITHLPALTKQHPSMGHLLPLVNGIHAGPPKTSCHKNIRASI